MLSGVAVVVVEVVEEAAEEAAAAAVAVAAAILAARPANQRWSSMTGRDRSTSGI